MKKRLFVLLVCMAAVFGLYAVSAYADDSYTVTFDTQGRGSVASLTIEAGYSVPSNIKPAGDDGTMCFRGWLLNGSAYDLSTPVNSNITLVANWQQHTNERTTSNSCTESENATLTCSFCGKDYTTTLPPRGHELQNVEAKAPTCTEAGWDAYQQCKNCEYNTKVEIAALSHNWKTVERVEPTCSNAGTEAYEECERCGAKNPDTAPISIPATGTHNWVNTVDDQYLKKAATCSAPAEYYKSCSVCGAKNEAEFFTSGSATGEHNFVNGVCVNTGCTATQEQRDNSGYSVTYGLYGPGTIWANGSQVSDGQTVVYSSDTQVTVEFRPNSGASLDSVAFNGESINVQNNRHQFTAMDSGSTTVTGWFKVNAIQAKTVAEPRQVLVTSGTAFTRAGTLASAIATTYHLSDASSIKYHVYEVTPVWSDGSEMNQDEIVANGGVSFTMAAPDGTSATTHRYAVYHYGSNGTYSYVSSSLTVTTEDFSPFAAFAIPLSASAGTVVVDPDSKTTPNPPTVTPVNMERVDDKVSKTGGFSVLNAAYPIEYRQDGSTAGYISVTGNTVSGLTAGRYYVRYAATATTNASGDTLTPIVIDDYYTVSTKLLYGKGTVYSDDSAGYADNVYLVKKGNNITFRFEPASHYWLHEIRINDQYVGQSNVKTPYVLRNVTKHVDLAYGFSDSSASPKTGDESNIGLWIAVGAVSAVAIAGIALYLIKKRK